MSNNKFVFVVVVLNKNKKSTCCYFFDCLFFFELWIFGMMSYIIKLDEWQCNIYSFEKQKSLQKRKKSKNNNIIVVNLIVNESFLQLIHFDYY